MDLFHVEGLCLGDEVVNGRSGDCAGVAEDQDAFAEDHQGRDRCDLQCRSNVLVGIGINLGENNIFVALMTQLPTWADGLPLDADGY